MEGTQPNGAPRGLLQCPVCGDWAGECLDPSPVFRGQVMRVHCPCANDNRCARCGGPFDAFRLNANHYDPRRRAIWHLPAFTAHNDLGTAVLLQALAREGPGRLLLASSMVIYGEGGYRHVLDG